MNLKKKKKKARQWGDSKVINFQSVSQSIKERDPSSKYAHQRGDENTTKHYKYESTNHKQSNKAQTKLK